MKAWAKNVVRGKGRCDDENLAVMIRDAVIISKSGVKKNQPDCFCFETNLVPN